MGAAVKLPKDLIESVLSGADLCVQIQASGTSKGSVAKNGAYLKQMSDYIQASPNLQEALKLANNGYVVVKGTKAARIAATYTGNMNGMVKDFGAAGGASVLGVFVDRFGGLAKSQGIELNECAMSVSKVATDIAAAGVGSVTAVTGWGVLLLGISIVSTYRDSSALAKSCFNTK